MKWIVLTPFFFILAAAACSSALQLDEQCKNKISYSLQSILSAAEPDDPVNIVVTLNDTSGIKADFPSLRIANAKIALGHLTKDEIFSLCHRNNVIHIEIPKTLYPTN